MTTKSKTAKKPETKPKATEFKPGDVVRLNSGGPDMTVRYIDVYDKAVHCSWMHEGNDRGAEFPAACLTLVPKKRTTK